MTFTKDMVISDVIREKPEAVPVLMQHGMPCVGCPASQMETLEEAAMVHGIDVDKLIAALNEALE